MDGFHPRAIVARPTKVGGIPMNRNVPAKLVIHTIEADPATAFRFDPSSFFGHQGWPHATIDSRGIHQHFPITEGARTLENRAGGVETNSAHAIQCEVMGRAEFVHQLPDATMRHLADWLGWCLAETGTPMVFADFVAHPASSGTGAAQRFSGAEWMAFSGICGHQHVPENEHGDPGDISVDRLQTLIEEDIMSPELATQLQQLLSVSQATNAAMSRVEVSVRDETVGLGRQIETLRQEIAALRV
jgi:hypothetical protein